MKREYHEQRSVELFGAKYTEIHEFLDHYFAKFGPYHRYALHHRQGIALVVAKFKGLGRKVAEQHIKRVPEDWNGTEYGPEVFIVYFSKIIDDGGRDRSNWLSIRKKGDSRQSPFFLIIV